jgi:hypothetical protein
MDDDWLRWKALASVVAIPMGWGATLSVLMFLSRYWPYGRDASLQAAATLLGAVIAFAGISWQIRATFEAQRIDRRAAQLERIQRVAKPLLEEVKFHSLMVQACFAHQDDTAVVEQARVLRHAFIREAFDRLRQHLDDLHNPAAAHEVEIHYQSIEHLTAALVIHETQAREPVLHALRIARTTIRQTISALAPIATAEE